WCGLVMMNQCLHGGPSILRRFGGVPQAFFRCGAGKKLPQPVYCLPVSLRMIGCHPPDPSPRKHEKWFAAPLPGGPYRLRTDELAESHHSRGVSKIMRRG